jgi:hypothetical protein
MAHPKNKSQSATPPHKSVEATALVNVTGGPSLSPAEATVVSVRLRDPKGSPVFAGFSTFIGHEAKLVDLSFLSSMGADYVSHLMNHPELLVEVVS